MDPENPPSGREQQQPRLLDQMRDILRTMGAPEVGASLTELALQRKVSASTQNQALAALLFLCQRVFAVELPWLQDVVRARHTQAMKLGHGGVELPDAIERKQPRATFERGHDSRTVQELLGRRDVKTTQIYTHVMRKGANAVLSPLDR